MVAIMVQLARQPWWSLQRKSRVRSQTFSHSDEGFVPMLLIAGAAAGLGVFAARPAASCAGRWVLAVEAAVASTARDS